VTAAAIDTEKELPATGKSRATEIGSLPWDALVATDMLGLAEFLGLCPSPIRALPAVMYFHENQLTYPTQSSDPRDLHFAYSNLTSALAADAVWFNSRFHREEFLTALREWLQRMPDFGHAESADAIFRKSQVQSPGIEPPDAVISHRRNPTVEDEVESGSAQRDEAAREQPAGAVREHPGSPGRKPGPVRIAWVSRWEHDKNPQVFFDALKVLAAEGVDFELNVLGESFADTPECFEEARRRFSNRLRHWGFARDRGEYLRVLSESDVVVSTAKHEFFGIAVLEAVAAGCRPLVPNALAYPETLSRLPDDLSEDCFHDGTTGGLASKLKTIARCLTEEPADSRAGRLHDQSGLAESVSHYFWPERAAALDNAIEAICTQSSEADRKTSSHSPPNAGSEL